MSRPITYYIVISQDNPYYKIWCSIEILSCLMSSYMYAYCSVFKQDIGEVNPGTTPLSFMVLLFEAIFLVSIILKFFLEFTVEDEPLPVRNMSRIAMRYLKSNDFIRDIVPVIPVPYFIYNDSI